MSSSRVLTGGTRPSARIRSAWSRRGAPTQVGPDVLLDVGDHHQPPLQALGPVGGEQPHRRAADPALGEGVAGDLLGDQGGEEVGDAEVVLALLGPGGGLEEGARSSRGRGGRAGRPRRPARPRAAGARATTVPDQSSHSTSSAVSPSAWAARARQSRVDEGAGPVDLGAVQPVEEVGVDEHLADQLARAARGALLGLGRDLLAGPQQPAEPAQVTGVEAAERTEQHRLRPRRVDEVDVVGVVVVEVEDGPQGVEQRQDGRVAHERHVVARDLDGHPGGAERATQPGDRRAAGADQDRHVVPRDAVLEVGAAQQVGEVLGLGTLGVEGEHLDPAVAVRTGLGHRGGEVGARRLRDGAGQGDAAGDALGGQQQPRTEPAGRAQRHHRGRRPVGGGERRGELEDAAHLRPPEAVDRLVRVADDGEVASVARQRPEQGDLAGVGVLVLVDEDVGEAGAQLVAVLAGQGGRAPDEVGVVDRALGVEVVEVLLQEQAGRDQLGSALGAPERRPARGRRGPSRGPGRAPPAPRGRSPGCRPRAPATRASATDSGWSVSSSRMHHVGLGRRQQPQRGVVEVRRACRPGSGRRRRSGTSSSVVVGWCGRPAR